MRPRLRASAHLNVDEFLARRPDHMRRAGETRVEAVQRAQDFERLVGLRHLRVHEAGLERADLALLVARRAVPRGGDDALVVVDLRVADLDPVTERAARRLGETDALDLRGPRRGLPFVDVRGGRVAGFEIADQAVEEVLHLRGGPVGFERARRRAAERGIERGNRRAELREQRVHRLANVRAILVITDQIARERPHLHRVAAPARRLDPRILARFVDLLDLRAMALGRATQFEMRLRHALERMQALLAVRIAIPRVCDELLHFLGVVQIDGQDLVEVAVHHGAARHQQVLVAVVVGVVGEVAVREHRLPRNAAADRGPILVERGDGDDVGQIHLLHEFDRAVDDLRDEIQALHVDRADRAHVVDIDRAGHAADEPVRMRILAAEHRMHLDDFLLEIERFEVMRDRHQIGFGRQLVGRMAPVAVAERPELARIDETLQPRLQIAEVARRGQRPVGNALREFGGALRVRVERAHHVDPVERVQVIEVHEVVVHPQRGLHEIADEIRILGNRDAERVLHRAHRRERVRARADAADALDERPRIARIAAAQDHFEAAPHRARGDRVGDDVVAVEIDFAAHVAFDARDRVDDHAAAAVVEREALGCVAHCRGS
ncbi:hypothetical protein PT2222_300024 [Paraburkholderia tropica]